MFVFNYDNVMLFWEMMNLFGWILFFDVSIYFWMFVIVLTIYCCFYEIHFDIYLFVFDFSLFGLGLVSFYWVYELMLFF